jgi:hypothetical protein
MTNQLELLIRRAGRKLRDHQVCVIKKIPEEFQQTDCDFYGYTRDGRAILIEAKMVGRPALPIGKSPGLLAHQWVALCEANRANVLALIVWQRNTEIATISVDMAAEFSKGRKSIPWSLIPDRFKHRHQVDVWRELFEPFLALPQGVGTVSGADLAPGSGQSGDP